MTAAYLRYVASGFAALALVVGIPSAMAQNRAIDTVPNIMEQGTATPRSAPATDSSAASPDSNRATWSIPPTQPPLPADPNPEEDPVNRPDTAVNWDTLEPFGASLFRGGVTSSSVLNPNYVVAPGDQVSVTMWGGRDFSSNLVVDLQGNIFIPEVGPVHLSGVTNAALNPTVERAVQRVFTDNVHVYTNLLSSQPVPVFVTGAVVVPGYYQGDRADSVLQYLARARGIDLRRGTFRSISVLRDGKEMVSIDLYRFLLQGVLPNIRFEAGDTIVVGKRGPTVSVAGDVRNNYIFEVDPHRTRGADIIAVAQPEPHASHVAVQGVRDGKPFNTYVTLQEFAGMSTAAGDRVLFQRDLIDDTLFIGVEGQSSGPSMLAVRRSARLGEVLNLLRVDPDAANLDAIYLRRKSVAERQRIAIQAALFELQKTALIADSASSRESDIRVKEAELIERFVQSVGNIEPQGRVVLANAPERRDDVRLEMEDVIVIPQKSDVVLVSGEVRLPQTVLWSETMSIRDYVEEAGGFSERADSSTFIVMRPSGEVAIGSNITLYPGDHLMVMPSVPSKAMALFQDVIDIVYKVAVSSAVVLRVR